VDHLEKYQEKDQNHNPWQELEMKPEISCNKIHKGKMNRSETEIEDESRVAAPLSSSPALIELQNEDTQDPTKILNV
jgi:hypothetical protein